MYSKRGFTLLELIIVMIIMGILAAIGVQSFMASQMKGRDATRKGDLKAIAQALELYYNDTGQYPANDVSGSGTFSLCYTVAGSGPGVCGKDYPVFKDGTIANGTVYMAQFPIDPALGGRYWYVSANGKQYQLYARLENTQDGAITAVSTDGTCTTGGLPCNYGVSSPNVGL